MPGRVTRWCGVALALGGLVNLLFLATSGGHFTGAHVMTGGQWALSHNAHFYASLLLLAGFVGLFAAQGERAGAFGPVALGLGLLGSGLFVGSGVITAFLLPVLAARAPEVVEPTGAIFNPPLPIIPIGILAFSAGWLAIGIVTWRAGVFPRWAGALLER